MTVTSPVGVPVDKNDVIFQQWASIFGPADFDDSVGFWLDVTDGRCSLADRLDAERLLFLVSLEERVRRVCSLDLRIHKKKMNMN